MSQASKGKVFLVGAGPGDPRLLTLRAKELIETADALVYDYLVHPALLEWARADCERVYVGKRAGFHALPQEEIEKLLVEKANAGKRVVRLKGGDPFVFGRGGEEARQLADDGIDFEVVPGISAALAAGAFAGIPLTHRELSSALILLTGHEDPAKVSPAVDWRAYAKSGVTLCIYMGMARLPQIVAELIAGGLDRTTPAACVQWASLGRQRSCAAELGDLPEVAKQAGLAAPAVIIIGEVTRFREKLDWFERRPLFGRRVAITRNREQAGELRSMLEEAGAEVLELPLVSIERSINPSTRDEVFAELGSYDWLIFSSANGVKHFFETFFERFKDLRSLGFVRIAAVGKATARAIEEHRLEVEVVPERATANDLADALIATGSLDSAKVLVVCGNLGSDPLIKRLESEGRAIVDRFEVYRTTKRDLSSEPAAEEFRQRGADAILFTSSSSARSFLDQAGSLALGPEARRPKAGSIGPSTTSAMRELKLPVDFEADDASLEALIEATAKALSSP
jgi:uroporphyrinogen III methyltransferase / synthase